jgi:hypothetical protein
VISTIASAACEIPTCLWTTHKTKQS